MSVLMWVLWALVLVAQNFSFTFVSRARNSGSLKRHLVAGIASNGVWFIQSLFSYSAFMKIITGAFGIPMAIFAALFYTAFTLTGSVWAHHFSLKTEKGKGAVGASAKYAQIPIEEWEDVKRNLNFTARTVLAMHHNQKIDEDIALFENVQEKSGTDMRSHIEKMNSLRVPVVAPITDEEVTGLRKLPEQLGQLKGLVKADAGVSLEQAAWKNQADGVSV
jgi:hypothetical protein